jgi:hypothetical protein
MIAADPTKDAPSNFGIFHLVKIRSTSATNRKSPEKQIRKPMSCSKIMS